MLCVVLVGWVHLHHLAYVFQECIWLVALWLVSWSILTWIIAGAEVEEADALLWLELYHLVGDFFQTSVDEIEFLEARQVLPQVLRWMSGEELLHLNQHIESTNQIWILWMQSLCYSWNASHHDTHVLPLLDREIDSEVVWHSLSFQQLKQANQGGGELFRVEELTH